MFLLSKTYKITVCSFLNAYSDEFNADVLYKKVYLNENWIF